MINKKTIILGVTASIAIYKACEIIRRLQEQGYSVVVVMTPEAKELISPVVFQSLSANKVYCAMFDGSSDWDIEHISLAERASMVVVAPATANIIGKVASGICDDLLSSVISATRAPVLFCPAMNDNMYNNAIVQDNIKKLKKYRYKFVEPRQGRLACGKFGVGCLADIEAIVKEIKKII